MLYESPYDQGFIIPEVDITTLVLDHNLKGSIPKKPAIIDGYSGEVVYTYQSLRDKIRVFAGFLQRELGIVPGDVVAYLSYNTVWNPLPLTFEVLLIWLADILPHRYTWLTCCGCRRVCVQSRLYG